MSQIIIEVYTKFIRQIFKIKIYILKLKTSVVFVDSLFSLRIETILLYLYQYQLHICGYFVHNFFDIRDKRRLLLKRIEVNLTSI